MTRLPRVIISLPPDIASALAQMKGSPEYQDVPKSKILPESVNLELKIAISKSI